MAQHRIMTILLFVCLSLCFEVAQSKLKKDGDPCIYSADCGSRCCHRDSPKGSGKCVQKSMRGVRCYGPNYGDPCFRSHQCNSGCCYPGSSVYKAFCVPKYDKTRKCLGPDDGDYCALNTLCKSGCCRGPISYLIYKTGKCYPKAAENEECNLEPIGELYYYCPCESGLVCEKDTSRNMTNQIINDPSRRICKKPNTANN
ncbi:leucine-rich colipase-like protein 1 isoform X2 [Eleutherodactylus coqui]|uniref:leucine-rich colipase-like protein 1 isoform X2 n=1 Tax=Eleutherodactylus coqui TaxID=57060 RepID=UPI0034626471